GSTVSFHRFGGGVDIVNRDGAFKTAQRDTGNDLAALLQGALKLGGSWFRSGGAGLDLIKAGRSPGLELPPEDIFVKAAGSGDIVGVDGEVCDLAGHVFSFLRVGLYMLDCAP